MILSIETHTGKYLGIMVLHSIFMVLTLVKLFFKKLDKILKGHKHEGSNGIYMGYTMNFIAKKRAQVC